MDPGVRQDDSLLDKSIKPSSIVAYLDQFVIGQDEAKRILAVAVYSHYRKLEQARSHSVEIAKSNVLLIGPSGTGKTLMCEMLSRLIDVPFVTADATSLAQTRYVNEEIDARSEEHTSELQSRQYLVCRLLLEKKQKYLLKSPRI